MTVESLFSGLKVLDFASFIAGPAATTVLSDFGAEVVKVEPPEIGDPYRYLYQLPPNPRLKNNYMWQVTNRNKRSLAFNLKSPQAGEVLARLVRWADVLVTNFPPRVRKGLKLTYEDVSPLNKRLIYADITGYGELGPEADKPGFDITAYWARSGLMQFTRDASSPPAIPVPGIGDHATAITLYAAIVTGLYRRERTGKGCNVSTSLIANGAWATAAWLQAGLFGAKFSGETDRKNPPNALAGGSYRTSDNRWLLLAFAEEDKNWPVFAKATGRPDLLADARFVDSKTRHANSAALVADGYHPVIIGRRDHVEVRGLTGDLDQFDVVLHDEEVWQLEDRRVPSTLLSLASFNTMNGGSPSGPLTLDSSGNLFGTTAGVAGSGNGTVFELPRGSYATLFVKRLTTSPA